MISQFRSKLYALAKLLGDVQAVTHKNPGTAIPKRIGRRIADQIGVKAMPTHLYQLCHNARRMDRHSEAELWARFKAVRPQDACAVTPARPAPHPMPEQIDAALKWARCTSFPELVSQEDIDREQYRSTRMLGWVIITTALGWASLVLLWIL